MKDFKENIVDSFGNKNEMLFERVTGSRLYGTSFEKGEHPFWADYESDWDYRGLYVVNPKVKLMLPPFNKFDQSIKLTEDDIEYYELEKFFLEALKNNPNYMDLLFGDEESLVGVSETGKILLENKNLFLSNKMAASFNGFAMSQLTRMKNHKKWFTRFPDIYDVQLTLTKAYKNHHVSFASLSNNFSGTLAHSLSTEHELVDGKNVDMRFEEMIKVYFQNKSYNIRDYMKPEIYDYLHLYSTEGLPIEMNNEIKHFLHNSSTFKKKNESLYFVYNGEEGVLMSSRAIRHTLKKRPDTSKAFRYLMHVDFTTFKSRTEDIKDLWKWKVERNVRRSELEERFGYDVKHAMHTYRLLDGAIETFENGTYTPRLSGKRLQEAKDILSGVFTYDEIMKEATVKMEALKKLSKTNVFPEKPDSKRINDIYMSIIFQNMK